MIAQLRLHQRTYIRSIIEAGIVLTETRRLFLRVLSVIGLLGALYRDDDMLYPPETTVHPGRWDLVIFSRNATAGLMGADD